MAPGKRVVTQYPQWKLTSFSGTDVSNGPNLAMGLSSSHAVVAGITILVHTLIPRIVLLTDTHSKE